jgi:hypothetical protein
MRLIHRSQHGGSRRAVINILTTALICLAVAGMQPVSAAPPTVYYYVDTTIDSNAPELRVCDSSMSEVNCSLRGAISNANVGSTSVTHLIYIPADTYVLTLAGADEDLNATGDLDLNSRTVILRGHGVNETIITQSGTSDRIIDHRGTYTLTLHNLTVAGGDLGAGMGGGAGIRSQSGSLVLEYIRITGNEFTNRPTSDDDIGGGLLVYNTVLEMTGTTIDHNDADQGAGLAIHNSYDGPTATIKTSTISNNTTYEGSGAGIWADHFSRLDLENVTIAENFANGIGFATGGGLFIHDNLAAHLNHVTIANNWADFLGDAVGGEYLVYLDINNSILYRVGGNDVCYYPDGTTLHLASNSHNIIFQTNLNWCHIGIVPGEDPLLGEMGYYGSTTQVIPLLAGSPAIDGANTADSVAFDQRGIRRRIDGDGDGTAEPDIGAYEVGINYFLVMILKP